MDFKTLLQTFKSEKKYYSGMPQITADFLNAVDTSSIQCN